MNYSAAQIDVLFETVHKVLPISGMEWDLVAICHSCFHPELDHTGDQLKKTFNRLAKTKIPTGDPNVPLHIFEGKEIRKLIIEKINRWCNRIKR